MRALEPAVDVWSATAPRQGALHPPLEAVSFDPVPAACTRTIGDERNIDSRV